jgi:glycosyltransferase involved in cell wall biosynthesis
LRILIAAPRLPFPPNDGGRIAMFNPIRHLRDLGHEVHVVAFAHERESGAVRELARHCATVAVVPLPRFWPVRAVFGDPPATLAHYHSAGMRRLLEQTALDKMIDIVELETLHMATYGRFLSVYPRVLRPQNVEHLIWERFAAVARTAPVRAFMRLQARRVRSYESRAISTFADSTLAVSEADRGTLSAIASGARVDYLPMGVDANEFAPSDEVAVVPMSIVITGSFDWAPKRHNLAVLVNAVFPLIQLRVPAARLTIVGKGLSGAALREVRARSGVDYVGPVNDVRPYIARSSVVVNYVESGSGIAIKVLEAMAMGKAVVTNVLGAEGIDATDGTHLLIASTKADFAQAVSALMSDGAARARLGAAARDLVIQKYASELLARKLASYFSEIRGAPRSHQV